MKLISVQSRGDRLVRITQGNDKDYWFWVCCKAMSADFEHGFIIKAPLFVARTTKKEAIQAAASGGCRVQNRHERREGKNN